MRWTRQSVMAMVLMTPLIVPSLATAQGAVTATPQRRPPRSIETVCERFTTMNVRRPERFLPLFWGVFPHIPQVGRAGGHALLELGREAGQ